jgi:protein-L-isoaspartate(D-aspartate) O-methyltransferase
MEQARFNMVEQQIRPWDVLDMRVLDLLSEIKRERFVPAAHQSLAFMDLDIPLGHGAAMWQPKLEARAVQSLELSARDRVLEIGTGSGYVTALLSRLAAQVTSVEIVPELSVLAARNLAGLHVDNITLCVGDAANGWGSAQYDAIVLTGSVPVQPVELLNNLAVGGRMFVIVGDAPVMHGRVIRCVAPDTFESKNLFEISVAPLQNAPQPARFVF